MAQTETVTGTGLWNEMGVLADRGEQGWRLGGGGVLRVYLEQRGGRWEHLRRFSLEREADRVVTELGWELAARSGPWVYYARRLQ